VNPVNRSDSFAGPITEVRAASTAGGGTALSTTAVLVPLWMGTEHVGVIVRNFATAVVAKIAVNPYLLILRSDNGLQTYTDYSAQGQQSGGTGISAGALDTLINGGQFYIGSHLPFRALQVTMSGSVNAVVATLLGEYWNGSAWVSLAVTDGTASGGATLAQTGNITWTVPTAWAKAFPGSTLQMPVDVSQQHQMPYADKQRYWTRWSVSAKLTTTVTINLMLPFNRNTTHYGEAVQDSLTQLRTIKGLDGASCIELLTDAGTANAIVNCYISSPYGAF
jgi:hypothetical protein